MSYALTFEYPSPPLSLNGAHGNHMVHASPIFHPYINIVRLARDEAVA